MKRFQLPSGHRTRVLTAVTGTLALSLAAAVMAAGAHRPEFPISLADAKAKADEHFKAMDSDGNGQISPAELAAAPMPRWHGGHHRGPMMGDRMGDHMGDRMRDRMGDHRSGPAGPMADDRKGGPEALDADLFERLDADGNGQLSKAEFTSDKLREARHQAFQARMFARLDKDGSGGISRDEMPDMMRGLEAMDANHDGTVTRDEARAFHQAHRRGPTDKQG